MTDTTQYPYSLNFSLGTILLMLVLMWMLFSNAGGANTTLSWAVYGVCALVFLLLLALLIIKRLIPALKGDVALELDADGISDYIRDIGVNWVDIENISLMPGRSASMLRIELKFESDYGNQVNIPLRWVKGNDSLIYETVLSYFNGHISGTRTDN
ncbi:MAG: hypothetical protein M3N14_11600 [Bacteroidota bacterium]|nr:hypothetical protein [Bacteroidota bacterium]